METGLTVKNLQHHSWALMIQKQSRSGLSIRDWCSQNNISTKTFYYRRKQIRANVKHFFTSLGKKIFTLYSKEFFTLCVQAKMEKGNYTMQQIDVGYAQPIDTAC